MFFYKSDSQETDIEWLSDKNSLSNQGTRKLWFTNQDANFDGRKAYKAVTPPANPTQTEHEYRLDWTQGLVQWYVDGVKSGRRLRMFPLSLDPGSGTIGPTATRAGVLAPLLKTLSSRLRRLRCTTILLKGIFLSQRVGIATAGMA